MFYIIYIKYMLTKTHTYTHISLSSQWILTYDEIKVEKQHFQLILTGKNFPITNKMFLASGNMWTCVHHTIEHGSVPWAADDLVFLKTRDVRAGNI